MGYAIIDPEDAKKLGLETETEQKKGGGGSAPIPASDVPKMDLDDPKIKFQDEGKVFDGSTYRDPKTPEDRAYNQKLYNEVGEESIKGLPRTQKGKDNDGRDVNYLVPPTPQFSSTDLMGFGDEWNEAGKVVTGAALEAGRSIAGIPEAVVNVTMGAGQDSPGHVAARRDQQLKEAARKDGMTPEAASMYVGSAGHWAQNPDFKKIEAIGPNTAKLLEAILAEGSEVGQAQMLRHVDANFPRMPQSNDMSRAVQDVLAIATTTMMGGKMAMDYATKSGAIKAMGDTVGKLWATLGKEAPANAARIAETVAKGLVLESGMAVGAAVGTPEDAEPLSQAGLNVGGAQLIPKGILPEDFAGSEETSDFVGHVVDNLAMSGLLATVGKAFGIVGKPAAKALKEAWSAGKVPNLMKRFMENADPDMIGMPDEEIYRRMTVLSDLVEKNGKFKAFLEGTEYNIDQGSTEALRQSAKSYYQQVLGDVPEEVIDQKSNELINRFINFKDSRINNPGVREADARVNQQAYDAMTDVAGKMASPEQSRSMAQQTAEALVPDLNAGRQGIADAETGVAQATRDLDRASSSTLQKTIDGAKKAGEFGDGWSTARAKESLPTDLYKSWKKSFDNYNALADRVPTLPLSNGEVAKFVREVATLGRGQGNPLLNGMGMGELFSKTLPEVADGKSAMAMRKALDGITVKDFVDARGRLSQKIDEIYAGNNAGNTDVQALRDMRDVFDGVIENAQAGRANKPYQDFLTAFKEHAGKWRELPELEKLDIQSARNVKQGQMVPGTNFARGQQQFGRDAVGVVEKSLTESTSTLLNNVLRAADSPTFNNKVAKTLISQAMENFSAMSRSGKPLSSGELKGAINQVQRQLRELAGRESKAGFGGAGAGPATKASRMFKEAVTQLEMAEGGLDVAKRGLADAADTNAKTVAKVKQTQASRFLSDIESDPTFVSEPNIAFNKLFSDPEAPKRITKLVEEATAAGRTDALEGVQGEYLRWLREQVTDTKGRPQGTTKFGEEMVRNVKGAKLRDIANEQSTSNVKATMDALFANKPEVKEVAEGLLGVMRQHVDNRSIHAPTFGTNSADRLQNMMQQQVNVGTKLSFGPLNRMGTIINTIGGLITTPKFQKEQFIAKELFDALVVDSDKLVQALDEFAFDASGETGWKMVGEILGVANKGMLGAAKPEDTKAQTKAAFKLM